MRRTWTKEVVLAEVARYLNTCYELSTPAHVNEFAAQLGIERSNLARVFRRLFGASPREILRRSQVERARVLLLTTDDTTETITAKSAFGTRNTFYRVFTEMTGCSPDQFRRSTTK